MKTDEEINICDKLLEEIKKIERKNKKLNAEWNRKKTNRLA